MTFPFIHKIKWKLTLVILVTSIAVLVLGVAAVFIYDSENSKSNLISQVDTMAEITAANISAALAFRDANDAQETLDSLRARTEIDSACLYFNDGKPFVFFTRDGHTLDSASHATIRPGHYFENKRLILKRRVDFGDETIGSIVICANLKEQNARSETFTGIALLSLLGLNCVALLLAARLQRLVSDPISQLAEAATRITRDKDYSVRVQNKSRDEIGSLVTAFNQMLAEIEQQNRIVVESESRLRLALSASSMGVWEWNAQTNTVSWSRENDRLFGSPSTNVNLETFANLIHPDDVNRVVTAIRYSVENQVSFTADYRVLQADGEFAWVDHRGEVQGNVSGKSAVLAGIVHDISYRKQSDADRQRLIAKLLHAEEDERRRIARELHDTTAQHLAFLKISFTRFLEEKSTNPSPALLTESIQILNEAIQEVRTLTYVLHPPVLEEFGLVGALRDFASGVTRRSGVEVMLHSADYDGRLPGTIELTLFRVIQESVSNAIRHSTSKVVSIRLARDPDEVRVEIQDYGRGLPTQPAKSDTKFLRNSGVGMAAMQERMALVGGTLIVESDSEGVTVLASLPHALDAPPRVISAPQEILHEQS